MGKMGKKISKRLPFSQPAPIRKLNADASLLADIVTRKIGENRIDAKMKEEIWTEGFQEGFAEAVASMCNVLLNEWGYLVKRDTRLLETYKRLCIHREELDQELPLQMAAEREFERQTGLKLGREAKKGASK